MEKKSAFHKPLTTGLSKRMAKRVNPARFGPTRFGPTRLWSVKNGLAHQTETDR